MKLHLSNLGFCLFVILIVVGFFVIGVYVLLGGDGTVTELQRERATGFGWTAVLGGLLALGLTWLVEDLSNIWCRPPKRWWEDKK